MCSEGADCAKPRAELKAKRLGRADRVDSDRGINAGLRSNLSSPVNGFQRDLQFKQEYVDPTDLVRRAEPAPELAGDWPRRSASLRATPIVQEDRRRGYNSSEIGWPSASTRGRPSKVR